MFDKDKQNILAKKDKSKKGSVDKEIVDIVNYLNKLKNYYTTSSCSGRIGLLEVKGAKKPQTKWLFLSHNKVRFSQIKNSLKTRHDLWLRQEGAIFHICCRTLEDARKMLNLAKPFFKRSGITSINKRILLEIISTESLSTPIVVGGKTAVNEDYIRILITESNKKLALNSKKLRKFYKILKNLK